MYTMTRTRPNLSVVFFLMIRRPPRSTLDRSSAASDVYKRQSEDHKAFQTVLSGILRKYLSEGHHIPALQKTSHEIVEIMKKRSMPEYLYDITDKALNIADLVKFANAQSRIEINYSFIEKVENMIAEAELFKAPAQNPGP